MLYRIRMVQQIRFIHVNQKYYVCRFRDWWLVSVSRAVVPVIVGDVINS